MKTFFKKLTKKYIVVIGSLFLVLFVVIALTTIHTSKHGHLKANKPKTTQTTKKSSKKKESSSSTSSSSTSASSQSSSEATSETQQMEMPVNATQTEQAPAQEYTQPAQPDDSCYPNGFQPDYFVSPDDASNATPSQDWHDDQVEWARQQGYLDE